MNNLREGIFKDFPSFKSSKIRSDVSSVPALCKNKNV
jgi:hypothetical protein